MSKNRKTSSNAMALEWDSQEIIMMIIIIIIVCICTSANKYSFKL
jgi:hypothetical protein